MPGLARPPSTRSLPTRPLLAGLIAIGLWLLALPALAQPSIQLTARADKARLDYGQTLRLQVEVKARGIAGQLNLQPPDLTQWQLVGRSQQTRTDGMTGQTSTYLTLMLRPTGIGELTIGAFQVSHQGRITKSNPIVITVGGRGPPAPVPPPPGSVPDPAEVVDETAFVEWQVDKEAAWVGEQITASLYLYRNRSISVLNASAGDINLDGFWNQRADQLNRGGAQRVQRAGRLYVREEVARYTLFPLRGGPATLPPVKMELDVRAGFGRRGNIERRATPVELNIRALPKQKRPLHFKGPAVGKVRLTAELDRNTVKASEGVQLTVTTHIEGLVQNVPELELADLKGFRVFPPTRDEQIRTRGRRMGGMRKVTWLLRPTQTGRLDIPSFEMPWFDPRTGQYQTARSPKLRVTVTGKATDVAQPEVKAEKGSGATGLRTIRKTPSMAPQARAPYASPIFIALMLLPPLLLLGLVVQTRVARHRDATAGGRSVRMAAADAHATLETLEASAPGAEAFSAVSRALVAYLEQRFEAPYNGMTHQVLASDLKGRGISEGLVGELVSELENCDFARFAPQAARAEELKEAVQRARTLVERIEAEAGGEAA